jgi:tetratricopeptide (TPR) repeat protein
VIHPGTSLIWRRRTGTAARPARVCGRLVTALVVGLCLHAPGALAQADCGSLENGYGPYDVRTATHSQIDIVEKNHFNSDVQQLRAGMTSTLGGDLSYTLRALPNHPRALWTMVRLSQKEGTDRPRGSKYTIACWFVRATQFAPDDGEVRLLYGLWLASKGQKAAAKQQLDAARTLIEETERLKTDPNMWYNLGLGYFDVGNYDDAVVFAKRARELGFPLQGLENKLRRVNKWPQ